MMYTENNFHLLNYIFLIIIRWYDRIYKDLVTAVSVTVTKIKKTSK